MTQRESGETDLLRQIREAGGPPAHVALIMDGNGRWARERGLPRWAGHRAGMKSVRRCIEAALQVGLEHLTLYAFSRENWERPADEVEALMSLLVQYAEKERAELAENGVRVEVFGDLGRLTEPAMDAVRLLERETASCEALRLHLAISYGSRDEIVRATRRLAQRAADGELDPREVDAELFERHLYTSGWPDPDLLIRTSGEFRISNFLLWQIAYSELYVTPVLWPDFGSEDLFAAIVEYQRRDRRFGKVAHTEGDRWRPS